MILDRGTLIVVSLDPTRGHEQQGTRPCVLVNDPTVTADQRYPMICVVPLTGTLGEGALYPVLDAGDSGLRKRSFALVDQLRSVDKRRIQAVHGQIAPSELAAIDDGLRMFLGLPDRV